MTILPGKDSPADHGLEGIFCHPHRGWSEGPTVAELQEVERYEALSMAEVETVAIEADLIELVQRMGVQCARTLLDHSSVEQSVEAFRPKLLELVGRLGNQSALGFLAMVEAESRWR